ncbi:hypothetical protein EVAR_22021_1 [Eumeta japonica]|uniref:Mariner Mos1 transposase n=1 Tax=Eumeta variegata TaxID=151549 RepID=A0A4C1Z0G1_EUMVA|nr:hypothetical protein EVAR_22021_1 [Eumeta japonica]
MRIIINALFDNSCPVLAFRPCVRQVAKVATVSVSRSDSSLQSPSDTRTRTYDRKNDVESKPWSGSGTNHLPVLLGRFALRWLFRNADLLWFAYRSVLPFRHILLQRRLTISVVWLMIETDKRVTYQQIRTSLGIESVRDKRPRSKIPVYQDNASPHTARQTTINLETLLKRYNRILAHLSYCPDLARCDFYLFTKKKTFEESGL